MCSPLGEEAGDVLAELAALPHATARKSTDASEPIDDKSFMQAMLAGLCDGIVTVLSARVERFFEPMMRVRFVAFGFKSWSATRAVNPARDFQTRRSPSPATAKSSAASLKLERHARGLIPRATFKQVAPSPGTAKSSAARLKLERETGFDLPGTKHQVEFVYRLRD
jgi:hypothetical protein